MDFFADFDFVDVITSGAIGEPGQRTFYIQARAGARIVTIRSEKQQVAAIAKYLRRALAHLPIPEGQPPRSVMQLTEPIQEAFVLGAVALEFNRETTDGDSIVSDGIPTLLLDVAFLFFVPATRLKLVSSYH